MSIRITITVDNGQVLANAMAETPVPAVGAPGVAETRPVIYREATETAPRGQANRQDAVTAPQALAIRQTA